MAGITFFLISLTVGALVGLLRGAGHASEHRVPAAGRARAAAGRTRPARSVPVRQLVTVQTAVMTVTRTITV